MLRLTADGIDLWLTYCDEIVDQDLLASYRRLLSEEERLQGERFYFPHDRHRHLVTRALVRLVLSRYAGTHPQDWRFAKGAFGRPMIANRPVSVPRLDFNISHTKGLIVMGVVNGIQVGVDVENTMCREAPLGVANRYFSPDEVSALEGLPRHRQGDRFFDYWTLKEAYIKARGLGLQVPLHLFSFHFHGSDVSMTAHDGLQDAASRWRFWQFRPRQDYLMAVCGERAGAKPPDLTVREIVPMISEKTVRCAALRMSP